MCDLDIVSEYLESIECVVCFEGFIFNYGKMKCEEVLIKFIEWSDLWGVFLLVLIVFCVLFIIIVLVIVI